MTWPLGLLPVLPVAAVTVTVALVASRNARRLRRLAHAAAMTGNPDVIDAARRRVLRSRDRHLTFVAPPLAVGMALLVTEAVSCITVAFPH